MHRVYKTPKCHENIKKPSTSLQLACLHLNINIYQRLIAVFFFFFVNTFTFVFFFALALLYARTTLKPLKSVGAARLWWHSHHVVGWMEKTRILRNNLPPWECCVLEEAVYSTPVLKRCRVSFPLISEAYKAFWEKVVVCGTAMNIEVTAAPPPDFSVESFSVHFILILSLSTVSLFTSVTR